MRQLVLASTSPYRRELMARLGLPFEVADPDFDETLEQDLSPELTVKLFSRGKARSLLKAFPDALIIGSDQVFVNARGAIMGKPGDFETARRQLRGLSGQRSLFYTGVTVIDASTGRTQTEVVTTAVTFRTLDDDEICFYLRHDQPFDCAGASKVEGLGVALLEKLETDDYTALIGLPLIRLYHMLESFGVRVLAENTP